MDSIKKVREDGWRELSREQPINETAQAMARTQGKQENLGIRDFTQNGRAARAGGGRNIARTVMKGLVRQQRKGESFLGVFGYAEFRGRNHLNARQGRGNLPHDEWIVGAPAGDDELIDFGLREDEAVQGVDDRERGEDGGGAD